MQIARTREELWSFTGPWRREAVRVALVPTMGNLHQGHLALVQAARQRADRVIASIFVNPTQFGDGEDFHAYPRTLDADQRMLAKAGCDLAFVPDAHTMYPLGLGDAVRLRAAPSLANTLEGEFRPGHFDGVVTVVARLFNLTTPDLAVFGEKDFQQLLVIRRMVEDLGYPLQILAVPTVRGQGGLALSSRNAYLDDEGRQLAGRLNEVLREAAGRIASGDADREAVEAEVRDRLQHAGMRVDYAAVRRESDLAVPGAGDRMLRILAAAWCGTTRLIDNVPVSGV
jgi:pantoate--beta-alanine ligase